MNTAQPIIPVAGRTCGDCAMCCKLPEIKALDKPRDTWCIHCSTRKKCDAYETRPTPCRDFYCGYMLHAEFGEEWHPLTSRMMVSLNSAGGHFFVQVDPARPDAWRKAPYYQQLKSMARANNPQGLQVIVAIGQRYVVVLPERDEDIGTVTDEDTVSFSITQTINGPITEVHKTKINPA